MLPVRFVAQEKQERFIGDRFQFLSADKANRLAQIPRLFHVSMLGINRNAVAHEL
jgi:hypothetical protein